MTASEMKDLHYELYVKTFTRLAFRRVQFKRIAWYFIRLLVTEKIANASLSISSALQIKEIND